MKSILKILGAIFTGILAVIFLNKKKPATPIKNPAIDKKISELKKDVENIEKREQELKEDGVPDLSDQEELDYWKKN